MSTDWTIYCINPDTKTHGGQRMAGSGSFGYGALDLLGQRVQAHYIADALYRGLVVRLGVDEIIPSDVVHYREIREVAKLVHQTEPRAFVVMSEQDESWHPLGWHLRGDAFFGDAIDDHVGCRRAATYVMNTLGKVDHPLVIVPRSLVPEAFYQAAVDLEAEDLEIIWNRPKES